MMGKTDGSFVVENDGQSVNVQIEAHYGFRNKVVIKRGSNTLVDEKVGFRHRSGKAFIVNGRKLEVRWIWGELSSRPKSIVVVDGIDQILWMHKSDKAAKIDIHAKMPNWAWVFILACAAIPILALGGALPIVIGIFGAMSCRSIAMNEKRSTAVNVGLCAGVAILAWASLYSLIFALSAISV